MMTYLEIVNSVLRRMREDEVNSVSSSSYSRMIGDLVNDAKGIVENTWDWSALRTTFTVETQADVFNYVLTGTQNNVKALDVINDTSNNFMEFRPSTWFNQQYLISEPSTGSPHYWTYNGVDANGDTQLDLYPKPDGVYTIRFNCVKRNGDLTLDADRLIIPSKPVLDLALALAVRERGETGGTSTAEYFSIADRALSDAIAIDSNKHPSEIIWHTP